MGYSLSWYAVKGKAPERVLAEMGLRPGGASVGWDHDARDVATVLPGGWYLVSRNRHEYEDPLLKLLSQGAEVIAFHIEEHVMVCKAAAWSNGIEVWSVIHDAQKELLHLEARGQLPSEFASIRDRLLAEQASEAEDCDHVIQIPYETAAVIAGYEHDAVREELRFEILEKVSFLKRLFKA